MKAYLIITGVLFSVLALLHVLRAITHWTQLSEDAHQMLTNTAVTVISAVLGLWAWWLLWKQYKK